MCVIAIYKNGERIPVEDLEKMMKRNPDGAGVAWNDGTKVHFKKGFTKPAEVAAYITKARERGARDIVFHARIATSGGVSPAKCHPFPITTKNHLLDSTAGEGRLPLLIHNGVFNIPLEKGLSDTQTFAKYALAPVLDSDPRGLARGVYDELLDMAVGYSKVALLYPDGVKIYGDFTEESGVLYSNTYWKNLYAWSGNAVKSLHYDHEAGAYIYEYGTGDADYEK